MDEAQNGKEEKKVTKNNRKAPLFSLSILSYIH